MSAVLSLVKNFPFGNGARNGYFLYTRVPAAVTAQLSAENFRKTVVYTAEHSPFYKRRFRELGIDAARVRGPEDLSGFYTTAEDIRRNPHEFVCRPPDTAYETTGTTSSRTKRVYFSRSEVREAGWAGAVGLWGVGVRPEDRIASAFDYSFWVSGPVLTASCEVLKCFHVEAGRIPPEEFYERLKDYGITVIVGDPSWLLALSEVAERKGPWPLKLMIGGGENFTESARRYCEGVWKCDFLLSYGQTEAFGAIGMESLDKDGYHLNEFHNFFEIVDRDGSGYGELVYTNLNRRVMPLVRYRSGDITRYARTPSKSGLPGRRIEKLKGRVNEWTPTAMGNIAPWMFEPIVARLDGVGPDWQISVEKKGDKDLIRFNLETVNGSHSEEALQKRFFEEFRKEHAEAWRVFEMGLFHFDVRFHPKGTLRAGRKLSRLLDRRRF